MPKIDPLAAPLAGPSDYPPPLNEPIAKRSVRQLGAAAGTLALEVNHVTLAPGAWSSQRHWHEGEDEVLVMMSGNAILIDDDGRHPLGAGDVAIFPANDGNGHHLINETDTDCVFVVAGPPEASAVHYPDVDMMITPDGRMTRKDGSSV